MKTYKSMAEIRKANKEIGNYFFSPSTMAFFKSKIETDVLYGKFFITSEINPSGQKRYTIREANTEGEINTIGEFHSFRFLHDAEDALKLYVENGE